MEYKFSPYCIGFTIFLFTCGLGFVPIHIFILNTEIELEVCKVNNFLGDGFCQDEANNDICNFDNGDCCKTFVKKSFCQECLCHATLKVHIDPLIPGKGDWYRVFIDVSKSNSNSEFTYSNLPNKRAHFGDTLETLWRHFRDTLETLWGHSGNTLGTLWGHFLDTLETLWRHFGDTLWTLWGHFWDTLGTFWGHFGDTSGTH